MWSNKAALRDALQVAGLGEWAGRLADLARPCIILAPGPIEDGANAPLGASRVGGDPDLPPGFDWPTRPPLSPARNDFLAGPVPGSVLIGRWSWLHRILRTQRWQHAAEVWNRSQQAQINMRDRVWPLSFVAQIAFAELHVVHPLEDFPRAGQLLLFCDPLNGPWGEQEDQTQARTVFTELPAESLERRRAPQEFNEADARELMPRGFVFKSRRLHPTAWLLPPPPRSCEFLALQMEDRKAWDYKGHAFLAYHQFWDELFALNPETFGPGGEMIHQVGGMAFSIQTPVEAECARLAGDSPDATTNWQLVLQIDSDFDAGMEWGDAGRIYLCARRPDLAARRFDRCRTIMQCY